LCWQWIAEEVISSSGEPQCVFMVWSFWLQHNTTPKTYRKHSCHWPSVCIPGIPCFFQVRLCEWQVDTAGPLEMFADLQLKQAIGENPTKIVQLSPIASRRCFTRIKILKVLMCLFRVYRTCLTDILRQVRPKNTRHETCACLAPMQRLCSRQSAVSWPRWFNPQPSTRWNVCRMRLSENSVPPNPLDIIGS